MREQRKNKDRTKNKTFNAQCPIYRTPKNKRTSEKTKEKQREQRIKEKIFGRYRVKTRLSGDVIYFTPKQFLTLEVIINNH